MPASVRRSFWQRNPWILPVILVILIAAIVLGVTFRSRIKGLASSATATATATPRTIVVTATPTAGAGTPVSTGSPTSSGGSTPLPGSTPVPTILGLTLGMITHTPSQVSTIQSGADRGDPRFTFYLDPLKVVQRNLPSYGFTGGFTLLSPSTPSPSPTPHTGSLNRPTVDVIIQYQGRRFRVSLAQPAAHGPKAIWLIVTIVQA